MGDPHYDVIIIGSGAGGGTMAHALAATGARILLVERGDFVPQEAENWSPDGRVEAPALSRHRAVARRARRASSCPTCTTASAATPSSGAACSTGCAARTSASWSTSTASRRPGPSTTRRWRPTTTGPSGSTRVHGQAGVDPTEPPRGPFPHPAGAARAADGQAGRRAAGRGPASVAAAARAASTPASDGGCALCNTCNSFPCRLLAKSDAEVCCVAAGAARTPTSSCGPARWRGGCSPTRRARA